MPALFPMMVSPESFKVGDTVRKVVSGRAATPFLGVVTHIVPATFKVWVQWPTENTQESPEDLIKVNPAITGMPVVREDRGYNSYEKIVSERVRGRLAKYENSINLMAIRVAHSFVTTVIGQIVDDVLGANKSGMSDVQAYYRIGRKYASYCPDYIIKNAIEKIYS